MSVASTIAVSGLNVASLRLQVAASNNANARSDGPLPGTPNPESFATCGAKLPAGVPGPGTLNQSFGVQPFRPRRHRGGSLDDVITGEQTQDLGRGRRLPMF